jgi:hypothetical protein
MRVACAEGHEGNSAPSGSSAKGRNGNGGRMSPAPGQQGPLTPQELQELSFLCTAASAEAAQQPAMQHQNGEKADSVVGFATVDGDQLSALVELLDRHVSLAVSKVHIVEKAAEIYQKTESPSQATAAIDAVRNEKQQRKQGTGRSTFSYTPFASLLHFSTSLFLIVASTRR